MLVMRNMPFKLPRIRNIILSGLVEKFVRLFGFFLIIPLLGLVLIYIN